jgi:hypothetical protein
VIARRDDKRAGRPRGDLDTTLAALGGAAPAEALSALIAGGHDRLPWPGGGSTLARWRAFAAVAHRDLSLAKLFEGHCDALAILHELGADALAAGATGAGRAADTPPRWAVWAAEGSDNHVTVVRRDGDAAVLSGRKGWCSGAHDVERALVTCWDGESGPHLACIDLHSPGVDVQDGGWHAVGMAATRSVPVRLYNSPAALVGDAGDYLARAGFWQGGAGIAACWYGGAVALADALHARASRDDAGRHAALGDVDAALHAAAAALREAAAAIDADPSADAMALALRVRRIVEHAATSVLAIAGESLGAPAYCLDARFARTAADLPVFLRQSHGARDAAALGARIADEVPRWRL